MHPETPSEEKDGSHHEAGEGVGRRLRAARLDRGLDLEQIAARLHLNPSLVDALEAGRHEALAGPVFILGYIRNYARQVGLDPEPLVAAYRSAQGQPEAARPWTQAGARPEHGGGRLLVRLMTILVIAGLGYLFVQWWQGRAPSLSELAGGMGPGLAVEADGPDATPPDSASGGPAARVVEAANAGDERRAPSAGALEGGKATMTAAVPDVADAASADIRVTPSQVPAAPPPSAAPGEPHAGPQGEPGPGPMAQIAAESGAESTPVAGTPEAAGAPQSPAAEGLEQGEVVLEFRGPCWVDVRDATKSFSLTGEMAKGDRRVLGGTPPYSLTLGNATVVAITVKGAPFDLTRVTKGSVARFKLDPANLP